VADELETARAGERTELPRTGEQREHPHRAAPDRLLTVEEVAEHLGVATRYVYDHHHEWPFTRRIGRKLRFSQSFLEAWLQDR
jgi:excisionase family DNA binding protein